MNNTEVTAQGMNVNATADDSLLIKGIDANSDDTDYTSIGTNKLNILNMHPSTSIDGKNFGRLGTSVRVESAAASKATWSGNEGAFKTGDIITASNDTENSVYYYAETKYSLKSVANDAEVYLKSIDVSDSEKIYGAVRVSVTIGDTTYIYNPGTANTDNKVGQLTGSDWALADSNYNTINDDATVWSLTADTPTDAIVRIWFEGQGVDCYTDNIKTTGTSLTLTFAKASA